MSHVYLWRKLKRELPPLWSNSALNGTLFEVVVGKMWFSTTRQSLGNRISASSVWLLMYVMDYFM